MLRIKNSAKKKRRFSRRFFFMFKLTENLFLVESDSFTEVGMLFLRFIGKHRVVDVFGRRKFVTYERISCVDKVCKCGVVKRLADERLSGRVDVLSADFEKVFCQAVRECFLSAYTLPRQTSARE